MASRMRADAQRNREQILCAARDVLVAEGVDAALDEIARRAGVGIATLYRRFPNREALLQGVAVDILSRMVEAFDRVRAAQTDPFEGLRLFMHAAVDLRIGAIMPALSGRFTVEGALSGAGRDPLRELQQLLGEAQEAGLVRGDVLVGDVTLMVIRLSRPLPGDVVPQDRDIAHRQLEIYLDGLRPAAARERAIRLPGPAIGFAWFNKIRERIAARD
ncbi:TetR/AcrR family transcriptional regulator [Streptomyces sp. A7024]|uniref:TetR/AcrR family transcriptional regulator n=1 Tax=Streptomyces coryli TaxID=1128680 RepID=A0A6G4UAQ5_9ACTN|nr:TetR/AcrR family transcriptional regulator [Streptomyces coryli]NGN68766.1 TetR/AcrR family transcriptional regulator [Streptomyces coryli]